MMNSPPPVIEIHCDDVTVEGAYLAARLGLSVSQLMTEMRRGIIYSVVERGMGELVVARNWSLAFRDDALGCGAAIPDRTSSG